ncbi:PepSY domain-containing protein [Xanthomonas albilineans]|uniref:PepSY domain-containing protein n=1 Tax=Xanthomonas albilineans TaxID=29447 RepID=UPI000AD74E31|nr:PepSY domain-containing protein [Xanthomonas albilineans]
MPHSSRRVWARLAWLHRWLGVLLCLSFMVWFSSGMVMLFVPFPSLPDTARWSHSEPLALAQVRIAPAMALAHSHSDAGLRLLSVAGQPRYVIAQDAQLRSLDGRTGAPLGLLSATQAHLVAARFGHAPVRRLTGPLETDQWIVHQRFDPWRPFYRVDMDDSQDTTLYISARTGEVMQRTRAVERRWNWLGSIPHWVYFTVLRHDFGAWDRSVWWLGLTALVGALTGTALGLYRSWHYRHRNADGWSPYRGMLKWHHGLGLAGAVIVLAWIFSGWLSMDHGRLFSRGQPSAQALQRYAMTDLRTALTKATPAMLRALDGSSEIDFQVVGGQAWASGYGGSTATATLGIQADTGDARLLSSPERARAIRSAAQHAWSVAATPRPRDDALYREADAITTDALRISLVAPQDAELYIDTHSGHPLLLLDASRQAYAWLYFALHTTRVPGLVEYPRLRIALQLLLLTTGWCLSLTGTILAVKRLRATARRRRTR